MSMVIPEPLKRRPRLLMALIAGLAMGLLLPYDWDLVTRLLVTWNGVVWFYLILIIWLISHTSHADIRRIAEQEDKGAMAVLAVLCLGSILSLVAIGFELASLEDVTRAARVLHYALTAITIFGSWLLVGMVFTLHYAHSYYLSDKKHRPLKFPDDAVELSYWDFLYFASTIAVAAQTSDVAVMNTSTRKAVTAQSSLSFIFNVAFIGLLINLAGSMIGGN
jgi:uncharacterized membrane protein